MDLEELEIFIKEIEELLIEIKKSKKLKKLNNPKLLLLE